MIGWMSPWSCPTCYIYMPGGHLRDIGWINWNKMMWKPYSRHFPPLRSHFPGLTSWLLKCCCHCPFHHRTNVYGWMFMYFPSLSPSSHHEDLIGLFWADASSAAQWNGNRLRDASRYVRRLGTWEVNNSIRCQQAGCCAVRQTMLVSLTLQLKRQRYLTFQIAVGTVIYSISLAKFMVQTLSYQPKQWMLKLSKSNSLKIYVFGSS